MEKTVKDLLKRYLLPYQQSWIADRSRFKIGMWSRQTGKSFATACEAVIDCVFERPGQHWVVLSAGERQALEWMEKAKFWVKAFRQIIDFAEPEYEELLSAADARESKSEIRFANGSRITAIPANPDTARGYSANIILDEFAIHENPFEIWAAIFPSVTSPHGGEKRLRIVSTPKGRGNKFADLWEHNADYSKHFLTIEDAAELGLKVDIDSLKASVDDPDIWAQEYLCQFIDSSSVLLPYELIGSCESSDIADDGISNAYIGMDIGRHKDLSVIVSGVKLGDVLAITDIATLRAVPFADQLQILLGKARAFGPRLAAVRIDSTGIGAMLAEEAVKHLGSVAQGVVFSVASKGEMFANMRRRFEERSVRIPADRELREDLHAVQRLVSTGGNITYSAPRSPDGHSDRASALALALYGMRGASLQLPPVPGRSRHAAARSALAAIRRIRRRSSQWL